ncbi:MAG TPA: hypothetical protein VGZ90_13705 [Puia sp.]|jgi:hypothetical protein|nr:hypothetical protein [Puia sp.]
MWATIVTVAGMIGGVVWHMEDYHTSSAVQKVELERRLHDLEVRCSDEGMDSIRNDIKYLKSKLH